MARQWESYWLSGYARSRVNQLSSRLAQTGQQILDKGQIRSLVEAFNTVEPPPTPAQIWGPIPPPGDSPTRQPSPEEGLRDTESKHQQLQSLAAGILSRKQFSVFESMLDEDLRSLRSTAQKEKIAPTRYN